MVCTREGPFRRGVFVLLFTVLGGTYPQKHIAKFTFWDNFCIFAERCLTFSGLGSFFGRTKPPGAAVGHNSLVLSKRTLLASMAHESTDQTSRRAEIPTPERRRHFASLCGILSGGISGPPACPACPVRTLVRHAGKKCFCFPKSN